MHRIFWLATVLLSVCLAAPAAAQHPDFSGMWTLDADASEFTPPAFSGGRGGDDTSRLFITHAANSSVVIGAETNGVKAWSFTPGTELTIPVGRDTTMRAASRWDGNRLVAEGTQGDMTMHEVMSLSPDGGTLTIEVATTTPEGERRNRLVYTLDPPVGPCEQWAMPCKAFPQDETGAPAAAPDRAASRRPAGAGATQGEWRQWGGPQGDFIAESAGLAENWPETGPPELWSRPLGAGHTSILVAGGRLFTMYRESHGEGGGDPWQSSESVIAMDAASGATLWEYAYASKNQDFGQGAGPHATPLLVGGRLFTMGSNKELHVFNPETGELLWSKNLITDFGAPPLLIRSMIKPGSGMSPIPYKDTILLQVGGPGQSVMALRQSDGEVVWKNGSFLVSHSAVGLISVAGRQHALVFAGQGVFGMDPDTGEVLWAHPHDAGNDFNFQVPLYDEDTGVLFFSSGYIGGSQAIRLVPDGDVVRTELLWTDPRLRFTFLNTLKIGDFVYGTSGQGAAAILTATHMESGETAWRERGFSRASMVYGDGKAILMEEDGDLSLVRLTPNGLETLATTPLFDTRSWTVPTLVGTTLYARDRARIVALDLGSR